MLDIRIWPSATWGVPDPSALASYQLHSTENSHVSILPTAGPRVKSDDYQHMEQVGKSEELMDGDAQHCDLPNPGSPIPKQHCSGFLSACCTPQARRAQQKTAQQNPLHGKGCPREISSSMPFSHYSPSTALIQNKDEKKTKQRFLRAHKYFVIAFYLQGTQLLCTGTTSCSWSCHSSAFDMV